MAQIKRQARDKWLVRVFLGRDGNGKRQFRNRVITGNKDDAKRWAAEVERDRDLGSAGANFLTLSVDALLEDLLQDYLINGKDYKTAEQIVRLHLRPFFGASAATKASTATVREFVSARQKDGAANATINRSLALLKRAFNLGRKATPPKVQRMPYIPMLKENNVRKGFFEDRDYRSLLHALPEHLKPVLAFAYWTGCRRGEILSLEWRQVDLENSVVRLDPGTTKNDEARVIPLVQELREMLAMQKARRDAEFPNCLKVCVDERGGPITGLNTEWSHACKAAGLVDAEGNPTKLLHDCRRTGVRNLVRAGVPEKVCMAISGHKTRSIFDRYNIVSETDLMRAAAKLQAHIDGRREADGNRTPSVLENCHNIVTTTVN
jgi:integrase